LGNREIRTQLAYLCSAIQQRFRAAGAQASSPEDFMFRPPEVAEEREAEAVQTQKRNMIEVMRTLALVQGGRTPRRRKKARK
jgi:hypothetical protein